MTRNLNVTALTHTPSAYPSAEYFSDAAKAERAAKVAAQAAYLDALADPTLARFLEYYMDAGNWGGTPLVGGNVGGEPADKGFIVNMKKRGWIATRCEDGAVWMFLQPEGDAVLLGHGLDNNKC